MDRDEVAKQTAVRALIQSTVRTPGWQIIRNAADALVREEMNAAIDEDDREKAEQKRLLAKAMRKGFSKLWSVVENTLVYDPALLQESGFEESDSERMEREVVERMKDGRTDA